MPRFVRSPANAGKTAAATLALAGAAVAGGRFALDRRARHLEDPARAYRLRADEYVPDGIRRIALGRIADAHDELGHAGRRLGGAVHETRKDLKRLRACLRLSRDALGYDVYERENTTLRMAGRRLSGVRDARVLVETIDALTERFKSELPADATAGLRVVAQDEHSRALAAMRADGTAIAMTLEALDDARRRVPGWTLASDDFDALAPGLERIYRRGRKRVRIATAEPTDENLHEARKRVKDLWHATQIVRPAAPKKLKRISQHAHRVADLLGEDHDLAVLHEYAARHPQCFVHDASLPALLVVGDRRRAVVQKEALELAGRLYEQSPGHFVAQVQRGWRKRAAERPDQLAG